VVIRALYYATGTRRTRQLLQVKAAREWSLEQTARSSWRPQPRLPHGSSTDASGVVSPPGTGPFGRCTAMDGHPPGTGRDVVVRVVHDKPPRYPLFQPFGLLPATSPARPSCEFIELPINVNGDSRLFARCQFGGLKRP
jgi:hypothetical protein